MIQIQIGFLHFSHTVRNQHESRIPPPNIVCSSTSQWWHIHCHDRVMAWECFHYDDVIMSAIVSQITSLTLVYLTFIRAQIKVNIKAPCHWPLCGEFTGDRWIPRTKGQLRGKCFHMMTSSWNHWPSVTGIHRPIVHSPQKRPVMRDYDALVVVRVKQNCWTNSDLVSKYKNP